MSSPEQRQLMGKKIVEFEARRDSERRIKVYFLPANDGGGRYEIAGINEKYHPIEAQRLRQLIEEGRHAEAETEAGEFITKYTDSAQRWTSQAALEFFLRDSIFNRGRGGAAKILQIALELTPDGAVGPITLSRMAELEHNTRTLLRRLKESREEYELRFVGRRENFWKGLVNRWDKAAAFAETFL